MRLGQYTTIYQNLSPEQLNKKCLKFALAPERLGKYQSPSETMVAPREYFSPEVFPGVFFRGAEIAVYSSERDGAGAGYPGTPIKSYMSAADALTVYISQDLFGAG